MSIEKKWYAAVFCRSRGEGVTLKIMDDREVGVTEDEYHSSPRLAVVKFLNETNPEKFSIVEYQQNDHKAKEITVYFLA